eukprot:3212954-Amphidinium_carterae.5
MLGNIKPITVNKLDIRKKEKKTEGIWLGKTTNSDEHIIATMDESGKAFYTRSLTRLTLELQWDKKMSSFFTKTRLNEKQSAHRLYNNNKEQRQLPPDLDNADLPSAEQPEHPEDILPPPSLDQPPPTDTYIHPTPNAMQPPAIVGQLDNILDTKELSVENNEDKIEKKNVKTIMKDIQVQPWWQYEDERGNEQGAISIAEQEVV